MTALLLVAALCAGCGSGGDNRAASDGTAQTEADNGQEGTAVDTAESTKADGGKTAAGENAYAAYQGYAYAEADGQVKYALDATDGLRLYCYFQSDSPAYEEVIYDLTLAGEGASTDVTKVVQEPDTDLTDSFAGFHFAFYPQQVVMTVERKEEMLAGGDSDNLLTGEYTLVPSDWKPQQTGEKADGRSTGAAEAGAETADFMAPYQLFIRGNMIFWRRRGRAPTMGMARLPSGSTRMYRLMQIRGIQPPLPGTRWMPMAGAETM